MRSFFVQKSILLTISIYCAITLGGCEFQLRTPLKLAIAESNVGPLSHVDQTIKDDWIELKTQGDTQEISFDLKNLSSSESIKVLWDDCSFIRADGSVERIIHGGVKLRQAGDAMPPTNIPKNAKIQDVIRPASSISMGDKGWNQEPLVRMKESKQSVGVLLVVQRGNEKREYTLTFSVPLIKRS
jgi:hypothetical protein